MSHRSIVFLVASCLVACSSSDSASSSDTGNSDASAGTDGAAKVDGGIAPVDGSSAQTDGAARTDAPATNDGGEALSLSFAFIGCNRISKADWNPQTNPSAANVAQLTQTLTDVAALPDAPKFLFFTGDLVLGLVQDTTILKGQLDGWAALYKAHPVAAKVALVPLVGNHEMLYKTQINGAKAELSNPAADAVWAQWLTGSGFATHAGNGPTNAGANADALQDDQSKLSYSFDEGGAHFVVLNTDTWTTTADPATQSTQIGWIALQWLRADLAAAQASAQTASIFVFGHKPIVNPTGNATADGAINPALTAGIEAAIDGTPKVKGFFGAHAHEWDAHTLPGTRGVYQIVAGNGGSALETGWTANPPYYGFTVARVYTSGRVGIVSYRRPVPSPYNATTTTAAQPEAEMTIAP